MEKARSDGLIERHAYSLLQVFEDKSQNIKLVQLRNPWGNGHESLLDWCDSSDKWKQHPDVAIYIGRRMMMVCFGCVGKILYVYLIVLKLLPRLWIFVVECFNVLLE